MRIGYYEMVECVCCKGGKRPLKTPEGNIVVCPYCKDTGQTKEFKPHPSHEMSEPWTDILAPAGTPRFYSIRECLNCKEEEWKAAAGHFLHELGRPCRNQK